MQDYAATNAAIRTTSSRLCRTLVCWTSALALTGLVAAPSAFADDSLTGPVVETTSAVVDTTPASSAVAPVTAAAAQPVATATSAAPATAGTTAAAQRGTEAAAGAAKAATTTAAQATAQVAENVRTAPQTVERIGQPTPHAAPTSGRKESASKGVRGSEKAPSAMTGKRSPTDMAIGASALGLPTADSAFSARTPATSTTAQATTVADAGQPAPKRHLPWPGPVGSSSTVAASAATALLLLLLFLFAEGLASAPPSFPRMLSLRRLLPAFVSLPARARAT